MNCDISGSHRGVDEVFARLRCYAGQLDGWLPKSATYLLRETSQKSEGLDYKFVGSKIGLHTGCPNWGLLGLKSSRITIRCRPLPSRGFPVHRSSNHSTNRSSTARDTVGVIRPHNVLRAVVFVFMYRTVWWWWWSGFRRIILPPFSGYKITYFLSLPRILVSLLGNLYFKRRRKIKDGFNS
jgi:hypothetical protein